MSDERKKRRWWRWVGWTFLVVFVLYPLSIGPAFYWRCALSDPFIAIGELDAPYAPIVWLCERSEIPNGILSKYLDFWVPHP
jgi:hypothetical protein